MSLCYKEARLDILALQKSQPISLSCEADWDGCCNDIVDLEKKKGVSATINIVIPDLVSIP